MKTKSLILLLSILYAFYCQAQFPQANFNTGIGGGLWQAKATPGTGSFILPVMVSPVAIGPPGTYGNWASPGANYSWIVYPFTCSADPRDHGAGTCWSGNQDVEYKAVFTLTNTTYILDLDVWADDRVTAIYVNGNMEYSYSSPSSPPNFWAPVNFKKCTGWLVGNNTIIIQTRSYGTFVQSYTNYTGFMVNSRTPANTVSIITSPPVCKNSLTNFAATAVTGATSYTWTYSPAFGGGASGQYVSPMAPNSTGVATVQVTALSGAGCLAYAMQTVSILNTTITASASSYSICPGATSTITASGAASYTWIPPVGTPQLGGSTFVATAPGTYTVWGYGPCTASTAITINPGNIVLPTVSNATTCPNMPNGLQLGATSAFSGGPVSYSWTWSPGGSATGQYIIVFPQVNTNYVVTASSPGNGCPGTATLAVTVLTNCCTQNTVAGMNVLTSNIIPTGSTLSGQIVINQNTTLGTTPGWVYFNNGEFLIASGIVLTVPPGVKFQLSEAHLYGCSSTMWQGITIQSGGFVQAIGGQNNVTLIEDAIAAIDIDNYSIPGNQPVEIYGTIFNKNYSAIRITNSSLTNIPIIVRASVFTSRDLPFTPTSWPNSSTIAPGLRAAINPSTGLDAPHTLQNYPFTNLKIPYNTQPGNIGVEINNIGDIPGALPSNGVDFGATNQVGFNLFDGLGVGIDITDASLTTMNNVFQNMKYFNTPNGPFGGKGIRHSVNSSSLMNARLNLSPTGGAYQNTGFGNRFWDCYNAVESYNVYDINAQYSVFRSTHSTNLISGLLPGTTGLYLNSNRFQFNVQYSEFNNINNSIIINITNGSYDMGSGTMNGVYASNLNISQNYFGAEVNSTNPLTTQYSGDAVHLNGPAGATWQIMGSGTIQSNKLNRVFRGIAISGMNGYGINIGGNLIRLVDDNSFSIPRQYGIEAVSTLSGLGIMSNTLSATGTANQKITLIHSKNNMRSFIECNNLISSYQAFEFEGTNPNTVWTGNLMQNHRRGLVLNNSGFIGQQGAPGTPCDNQWNGTWTLPSYETFVIGSNAPSSPLWVQSGSPFFPFNNGSAGGTPYNGGCINTTGGQPYICKNLNVPAPPSQRIANVNAEGSDQEPMEQKVNIFPNPSSGYLMISGLQGNESLILKITDVTGKVVFRGDLKNSGSDNIDISSLANGLYLVEIGSGLNKVIKKLVLAK